MPRRPTSTPTPSPSRRMINVMVTGLPCAYRLAKLTQTILSSSLEPRQQPPLRLRRILGIPPLFLFAPNLLYLIACCTSALWPAGGSVAAASWHPQKRESLDSGESGVIHP